MSQTKIGFLNTGIKSQCLGCGACKQACPKQVISLEEDREGFRYPKIDSKLCIHCGMCNKVCPIENPAKKNKENKYVYGGYSLDKENRNKSTSGGIFFELVKQHFLKENAVVYGASADGLTVFHERSSSLDDCKRFRKSKYSQSDTRQVFKEVREDLKNNKRVIFSGTPCQIAALKCFLLGKEYNNLLTVEVVCEGVPTPLYLRKTISSLEEKKKMSFVSYDYRCKSKKKSHLQKWDFQMEEITFTNKSNKERRFYKDRWFNPFWSIWLQHLMSRPSCYECPFTEQGRVADITLGDLWGVHIYCPELYGKNGGASVVICNTEKGRKAFEDIKDNLYGHELKWEDAIRYQGPLRKHIETNPKREDFMNDLIETNNINKINKKWAKKPTIKLLFFKYIYGNRQVVAKWNLLHKNR